MKIYNKKGFFIGIAELILFVFCIVTIITEFDWKLLILGIAVGLFGIVSISNSLSKEATDREQIEKEDERVNLVKLKAKAKISDIISWILFLATAAGMIAYGVTNNQGFVFMFIGSGIPLSIYWIGHIIATIYYEKHE
ncbi:MAG: hypothetical protein ACLR6S_15125 [Lacrimispora saccharolytica]